MPTRWTGAPLLLYAHSSQFEAWYNTYRVGELQTARFKGGGYERTVSNDHYS